MSNEKEIYIDWSKEPEATHYQIENDEFYEAWVRIKSGKVYYKVVNGGKWSVSKALIFEVLSGAGLIRRPPTLLELLVEAHEKGEFEWHPKAEFYYQDGDDRFVFGYTRESKMSDHGFRWRVEGTAMLSSSKLPQLASDWNVRGVSRAEFEAAIKPNRAHTGRDVKVEFPHAWFINQPFLAPEEIKPLPLTTEQRLEQLRLSIDQIAGALDLTKDKGAKESLQSQLDDLLELQFEILSGEE